MSSEQDMRQLRVRIFDALSKIVDPEINTSITDLELIDEVDIQADNVKVDLHLTSPFCPTVFGFKICQDIHDNLLQIDGVGDVKVNVSNHIAAEMINNQVNSSPNPKAAAASGQPASSPTAGSGQGQPPASGGSGGGDAPPASGGSGGGDAPPASGGSGGGDAPPASGGGTGQPAQQPPGSP